MVRIVIKNGNCGAEEYFRQFGTEGQIQILQICMREREISFKDLKTEMRSVMSDSQLAKRLTEFVACGMLDKLTYRQDEGGKPVYRVTQKTIDIMPVLDMIRDFVEKWGSPENARDASTESYQWVREVRKLIGSRWNARILWLLYVLRGCRFNELKDSIEGVSFKVLTQQLKYLEQEGVVLRKDYNENPPRVEYSLTEKGEALYDILLPIARWFAENTARETPNTGTFSVIQLGL